MRKVFARQLRLVTLLTVGLCGHAHAQTPDFSLPPLPPVPGASNPSATIPTLPPSGTLAPAGTTNTKTVTSVPVAAPPATPQLDAIPELAGLPTPADPTVTTPSASPAASATENALATDEPAPADTDSTEAAVADAVPAQDDAIAPGADDASTPRLAAGSLSTNIAAPPTTLPGLGLPVPPPMGGNNASAVATNTMAAPTTKSLPGVEVESAPPPKPVVATWKTKLAPAIVPNVTKFNYRRQVLPAAIYSKSYGRENAHLPPAVTREDYARLLLERVAANDVNGTRALLNTGLSTNINEALNVARQSGANDTARLLVARGAS